MGLKLGSLAGIPKAPPESRRVPDGQVAVVVIGALPWVPGPTGAETLTTVAGGPPVAQSAKALAWSLVSLWPPKPATAVQFDGVVAPSATGLPEASDGMVPLSLSPLPGVELSLRCSKAPPPTSVVPDGQVAVTLIAEAEGLVIGAVAV